jgi:hypothetical protein
VITQRERESSFRPLVVHHNSGLKLEMMTRDLGSKHRSDTLCGWQRG